MTRKNRRFFYPSQPKAEAISTSSRPPPVIYTVISAHNGTASLLTDINKSSTQLFSPPVNSSASEGMPPPTQLVPSSSAVFCAGTMFEDHELELLGDLPLQSGDSTEHELRTAPVMTRDAYIQVASGYSGNAMQYGVMGRVTSIHSKTGVDTVEDPRLYVNTNAPFSAVVCGVQGSGKSHTVSVLLENMFISNCPQIGSLSKPLSGLVLHFGEGGAGSRPSEASWIGVPRLPNVEVPPVRVYVSRSSLNTMKRAYSPLGTNVTVEPLLFDESELDAEAFLSMMAVGSSESAPLYVQIILCVLLLLLQSILRDLGENFTYPAFMAELDARKRNFNPAQQAGLEQRLSLLNSFMGKRPNAPKYLFANSTNREGSVQYPRFAAGRLTIIDLSDPFIDAASACGLFEIVTRLFVRADVGTGKVLVVDEAHKYLSANNGVSGLTKSLLTVTREQRHLAMRVIISTQEPTVVPPVLLDLCTVAVIHRFSSPAWWEHLSHHVSANISSEDAFDKVVRLQTGEAIVLAPSGLGVFQEKAGEPSIAGRDVNIAKTLGQFGRRYLHIKTRKRVTADGGASILVLNA